MTFFLNMIKSSWYVISWVACLSIYLPSYDNLKVFYNQDFLTNFLLPILLSLNSKEYSLYMTDRTTLLLSTITKSMQPQIRNSNLSTKIICKYIIHSSFAKRAYVLLIFTLKVIRENDMQGVYYCRENRWWRVLYLCMPPCQVALQDSIQVSSRPPSLA